MSNILKKIERDENGLIKGVNYIFDENGLIDWRKMIDPKYLVVNKQNFERRKQPVPETIDGLADKDLLILLQGIKELAHLRGYTSITYQVVSPSIDYIAAICTIEFIGNYETRGQEVVFSAIGDAHPMNTKDFGRNFLAACAENRAFVRAIRNHLRISVISSEEISGNSAPEQDEPTNAVSILENLMKSKGVTFDGIKKKLIKENFPDAEKLEKLSDIPPFEIYKLI